jgi:GGDEF domain-containing protein
LGDLDRDRLLDMDERLQPVLRRTMSGGDAALKQIAAVLRDQLRDFDHLYRFGGEEIVVLVPGASIV